MSVAEAFVGISRKVASLSRRGVIRLERNGRLGYVDAGTQSTGGILKHTISALVRNEPGVLAAMARHFGEAKLNIKSIACGETENPDISRMVIRLEAGDAQVSDITEQMAALDFVIQVDDLSRKEFVDRELALIKVGLKPEDTAQIMQVFEVFRADVVGMGQSSITVELTGDEARVDGLIKMLKPYGILSMCRTGTIALKRGDE